MMAALPPLTEFGFLPVPPPIHIVRLEDMPGCFGAKPKRMGLWNDCVQFIGWLREKTPVREVYIDGRFLSASDEVTEIEVGIELTPDLIRGTGGFEIFNIPAHDEFGVRVRYYGPHRPSEYNFHEEFNTPDPEIRLRGAPVDLRKGYICISL
jgi:hypothetical protein